MRALLTLFIFIASSTIAVSSSETAVTSISIFSRESVPNTRLGIMFSADEQAWLNNKKQLVLAVPAPDNPPLDISLMSGEYEGVTADVVALLSATLGVRIIARRYETRSAALQAIRRGEVDLVGSANTYESFQGFLLSKPYIADTPTLFIRPGIQVEEIESIAIPQDYLPDEFFHSLFRDKKITRYSGRYSALASVAYKRNDAVLVDLLSGNFLVNKYYLESVEFGKIIPFNSYGFSFALSPENKILQRLINKTIEAIPITSINSIYQRWAGGGVSLIGKPIRTHCCRAGTASREKEITLAVNNRIPPMGFVNQDGYFRGILADLVQTIRLRLGVNVNLVMFEDLRQQLDAVQSGDVDLTITSPSRKYNQSFSFSRAIVLDPLVYVIRKEHYEKYSDVKTVLKDGPLALVKNTVAENLVEDNSSDNIRVKYFESYDNALACVANLLCVAAIVPLRPAQYFINSNHTDMLTIGGELYDSQPVAATFTARGDNRELIGIIDKVISSIPPNELEVLSSRWRVSAKQETLTLNDVFHQFWLEIVATTTTLLIAISWALILRRQNIERKRAQLALKQQLKFMDDLVDSIPHPIFARDKDNNFILCNKSYCNFVGVEKDIMLGSNIVNLPISEQSHEELREIYRRLHERGTSYDGDHLLKLADGRSYHVYYWLHIYHDLTDEISGIIGGWLDISDRHRLMEELAAASQRAEYANRAKTTFLATMSHEIRTPMNAIIGMLELTLRKGGISVPAHDSIEIALKSANELLGLIGDILDISKIESGKLELALLLIVSLS